MPCASRPERIRPQNGRAERRDRIWRITLKHEVGLQIAQDFSNNKNAVLKQVLRAALFLNDIKSDFYFTSWWLRALMFLCVPLAVVGRALGI